MTQHTHLPCIERTNQDSPDASTTREPEPGGYDSPVEEFEDAVRSVARDALGIHVEATTTETASLSTRSPATIHVTKLSLI